MLRPPSTSTDLSEPPEPDPDRERFAAREVAEPIDTANAPAALSVNSQLSILFEDSHCLAIIKPLGQLTQGTWAPPGELTLEAAVRRHLNPSDPGAAYLGMVHRLDRPTSGVLLWAKTSKAARRLSSQFEHRRVDKEYWAIVEIHGASSADNFEVSRPSPERTGVEEVWTDWLTRPDESGVVSVVAAHHPRAREAVTRVERRDALALPRGCAWLRLGPRTGRTHQLRAQATRRGMPILGDSTYGATLGSPISPGIALHARLLTVRHPILNYELTLVAPVPASWAAAGIVLPDL